MKIQHPIPPIQDEDLGIAIFRKVIAVEFFENVNPEKATIKIEMRLHISQFVDETMTKPFAYEPKTQKIISIDNSVIVNKNTGQWVARNGKVLKKIPEEDKITELQFYEAMLSQLIIAGLDRRSDI